MASQKLQRYLSVLSAKGVEPDPLVMAKMMREEAASGQPHAKSVAEVVPAPADSIRQTRKSLIDTGTPGNISDDPEDPVSLSAAISGRMGLSAVKGMGIKGTIKGTMAAATAPETVSAPFAFARGAASALTTPVALALAINAMVGSSASGEMIGSNVTQAFGEEAASDATAAIQGKIDVSSLSPKSLAAYANAKVAMESEPKSIIGIAWNKMTSREMSRAPISTVTEHHTDEAITDAFQVSPGHLPDTPYSGTIQGLHDNIDAMNAAIGGGDSDGNIGSDGGGESGIGPGNF